MTFLTFLLYSVLTIFVLILIRHFWYELAVVGFIIYVVGSLTGMALISAILWAVFVKHSAQGWGWSFLYFFLAYGGIVLTYALIVMDVVYVVGSWIAKFIKSISK